MNDGDNVQNVLNCGWEGYQASSFNYSDHHAETVSLFVCRWWETHKYGFCHKPNSDTHPPYHVRPQKQVESVLGLGS